jgi:hypothetical protein
MRTVRAYRVLWLVSVLLVSVQWLSAQNNLEAEEPSAAEELSALLPDKWLVLQPSEIVTFVVNPFTEGIEESTNWFALTGEVLSVSKEGVVYQAPDGRDETFDVLIWHNPATGQWITVAITLICEDEPEPISLCNQQTIHTQAVCSVPISSNVGIQVFAQTQRGSGFYICLPGRPLNPPPSNRNCSGGNTRTERGKFFSRCDPDVHCRTVVVDANLAARIWRIFRIRVAVGTTVRITKRDCIDTKIVIQDCYKCVNGQWQYTGTRVFWRRIKYQEVTPNWGVIFCPIGAPRVERGCISSGDCPCP